MKKKQSEHRPAANPEMHRAMVGKRSSGAAGTHQDGRKRRARTRSAAKRRAMRDE